jgi:uncharacterized protein with von Willebrand factor type A (vWA) domain
MSDLASAVARFCERLRVDRGFAIGRTQTHDALRAAEIVGITKRERLRAALRAVCCMRAQDVGVFDRAFDAFFSSGARDEPQSQSQRHRANEESTQTASERKSSYGL